MPWTHEEDLKLGKAVKVGNQIRKFLKLISWHGRCCEYHINVAHPGTPLAGGITLRLPVNFVYLE